jgi:hypothetical protein
MRKFHYLHITEGRLRVKVPRVKGDELRARRLEQTINDDSAGILLVKANPTTGNVLVNFDPEAISHAQILETIEKAGYFISASLPSQPRQYGAAAGDQVAKVVTNHLVQAAVQAVFEKVISGLI